MDPCIVIDFRTATDHFPGIGRYTFHLVQALKSVKPQLNLRILKNESSFIPPSSILRSAIIDCPMSPFSLSQQWIVPRLLRQAQANLYHSPYYLMPYRPGFPTIVTFYDLIPLLYPQYSNLFQRCLFRLAHILASKTARIIISISKTTKADLIRHFQVDPDRIVVIPLAVDHHLRPCSHYEINRIRHKLNLPEKYVLYLGTNKPHKNLESLIKAFARIVENPHHSEVKLVIAGPWDGRYPQPKKVVEELGLKGHVLFIGLVEEADLPALYTGATLFVFPSLYEGFGFPVLEAMACGKPVVCSNTPCLSELAGEAAILVNPLDVKDLASAMDRVFKDEALRQEMQNRSLQQAIHYSWEQTAKETLAVYETVLGES